MQTFLPYARTDMFYMCGVCLDVKRHGKQRIEAWQIHCALNDEKYGWQNHPAIRMWRGYDYCLLAYGYAICQSWQDKGYKDSLGAKFEKALKLAKINNNVPQWLGDKQFHSAHRAILLAKNYDWYKQFGWSEKPAEKVNGKWPYVWPV